MTAAYQPNSYQPNAYQVSGGVFIPAFDGCAFQVTGFQANPCPIPPVGIPAFDGCTFQYNAFQASVCPIPPPPEPILDGHDGGRRKKALKKIQELEDKRIEFVRKDAEHRKMLIRHALDPQAKAEYEKQIMRVQSEGKPVVKDNSAAIAKIDAEMARIERLKNNLKIQPLIRAELGRIQVERAVREREIRRQIQEADDELALMMMM